MNVFKRLLVGGAVLATAGGVTGGMLATSASAAPPPPPVLHVINTTSVQTSTTHIGPAITINRFNEYQPSTPPAAPGFQLTGNVIEVCFSVPHVTPPTPTTVLAQCNWTFTSVPGTHPASRLVGRSALTGLGQVGRVLSGTGTFAGAHSLFPGTTIWTNLAPRVQSDHFQYVTPAPTV
jgi:hypothetical protein